MRKTYWSGVTDTSCVGLDRAGHPGEERAAGEGEQLEAEDVDAHGLGGLLVLADGHPAAADPAVVEPDEDEDDEAEQQQQQEVVVREPAERDADDGVRLAEVEAEELRGPGWLGCRWARG